VRGIRVWARLFGLARVVVEDVVLDGDAVVVCVRPRAGERGRCGICRRRCARYDWGEGRRRWRALDMGTIFAYVEAEAPRVTCRRHGVVVAAVPWARHASWFTTAFEDQCAWLAVHASASAVAALMRTSWRAVDGICERVADEACGRRDPFAELRRIGVDEISIRRGQRYLTVVIDHDSGRLIWAAAGRDRTTVETFLALLGTDRCAELELVSCDMAEWITRPVAASCPNAEVCLDAFHVVKLATDALDEIRREVWNEARRSGHTALARELKGARFALWKNPENLTPHQQIKLAHIQRVNQRLYRAYLLKEQLRQIYRLNADHAIAVLDAWLQWARRCRLAPFVKLARTIRHHRAGIEAALRHTLSNARTEQINTQIRLITRRGFGYHSPQAVIALAMLSLGGLCPPLPGR
jgi:transposase